MVGYSLFYPYVLTYIMKSLQKTLLIAGGTVIGIAVAGGMFAYQDGKIGRFSADETVQAAIDSNDYAQLSDAAQSRITEEKFAEMIDHQATRKAVETAIENNDYGAFVEAADDRMLERINSQEAFDEFVVRRVAMETHKAAIEEAVANNDYNAFVTEMDTHKAEIETNKPADAPERDHNHAELTNEQKQKKFQELVNYYVTNGELPDHGHRHHQ